MGERRGQGWLILILVGLFLLLLGAAGILIHAQPRVIFDGLVWVSPSTPNMRQPAMSADRIAHRLHRLDLTAIGLKAVPAEHRSAAEQAWRASPPHLETEIREGGIYAAFTFVPARERYGTISLRRGFRMHHGGDAHPALSREVDRINEAVQDAILTAVRSATEEPRASDSVGSEAAEEREGLPDGSPSPPNP